MPSSCSYFTRYFSWNTSAWFVLCIFTFLFSSILYIVLSNKKNLSCLCVAPPGTIVIKIQKKHFHNCTLDQSDIFFSLNFSSSLSLFSIKILYNNREIVSTHAIQFFLWLYEWTHLKQLYPPFLHNNTKRTFSWIFSLLLLTL